MFQNFLLLIERPDLLNDTQLATIQGRMARGQEWQAILDGYFAEHEVHEIVERAVRCAYRWRPCATGRRS